MSVDAAAPEPVRRARGRPRDPDVDLRITRAAAHLLLHRGFERTTVDDVARTAGVGKATVYRRWARKEDLALAAMQTLYTAEIPEPDTGSIRTDLAESYRAAITFVNSSEGAAFLRMSITESVRDDRIASLYKQTTQRREAESRRTFERAIARGEVRPDADLDSVVQWLGGLLTMRAITRRPMPTVDDVDALVEFTLHGVLA